MNGQVKFSFIFYSQVMSSTQAEAPYVSFKTQMDEFDSFSDEIKKVVRISNSATHSEISYLTGRLLTFIEAIGGSDEVIKARKDVIRDILEDLRRDSQNNNHEIGRAIRDGKDGIPLRAGFPF